MKTKKILALALCAVMLVGASIMGTMAYLTDRTQEVKNTFTVGNVSFDATLNGGLDEADVDENGALLYKDEEKTELADRVTENTYKLVPAHTYVKDPTVHMSATTEDAFLFVEVVDGLADIEAEETVADQMTRLGWVQVSGVNNVWCYATENGPAVVKKSENKVVFESFTLKNDADVAKYVNESITIKAYAVQADGFSGKTAEEVWAAAFAPKSTDTNPTPEQSEDSEENNNNNA